MKEDFFFHSCLEALKTVQAYHDYHVDGMESVPSRGPAMIVVNHSLATYDSLLLGAAIYLEKKRFVSALADRQIFKTPIIGSFFTRIGAVEGSPEAGEKLLREGNLLALSPGGMRESLRPTTKRYQIDWEGRLGFARLAIKAQVPVILAACPHADDIFTVHENLVTQLVYEKFRWPLPLFHGLGPTLLPRPVRLTHYLSKPIDPPKCKTKIPPEKTVAAFHAKLTKEMNHLMRIHS